MDSSDDNSPPPKGRPARGRGRGRGRPPGRPPKKTTAKKRPEKSSKKQTIDDIAADITDHQSVDSHSRIKSETIEFDENLDTESLTTHAIASFVSPGAQPLHRNEALNWKYKVNLIGEKVVNPRIHCCDKCLLPILVYGRMIPCKHVFCLNCAKQHETHCPRCGDKVVRVEKSGLGTVFMCQTDSCKRTYLSQRDLQAHIQHRHIRRPATAAVSALNASNVSNVVIALQSSIPVKDITASAAGAVTSSSRVVPYNSSSFQSPIPVVSSRNSNLITVPIQDEVSASSMSAHTPPSSLLMSPQQPVSSFVSQQSPYGHHNLQWPPVSNATNTYNTYRQPQAPAWGPPINPYTNHNPYGQRPYGYPQ